jgi:hypothetical protein
MMYSFDVQIAIPVNKYLMYCNILYLYFLSTIFHIPEVPKYLATLNSDDYSIFVHSAAREHWWLVEQLLDMYSSDSHSTSQLAKDIDLTRFFGSTGNYHR